MFRPSENIFDADRKLCGRTLADSRTPAKRIPLKTLPIWELSSEAFLVYIAAVLFYKPIFTQPLGFVLCAAGAVEKFATDGTVGVVYPRDSIGISKINAAFLTGQGLEEKRKKAEHRIYNLHFVSLSAGVHGKKQIAECVGDDFAEAFCNFRIDDPYEICFAILYLLDQDDDYAWVYSFMTAVVCRAAAMLPWGLELYSEMDDGIWFQDNEWIEPKPFDPEWYETKYAGELYEDDDDPHDVSLAQLVYQYTGAVLPRDMNRFDGLKKELRAKGLKPSQVSTLCAMMNVIGEVSRQRFDFSKYADQDDWDDCDVEEEAVTEDLASENEKLKAELAKLRKQAKEANYNLSRENRELKDQLEKMEAGAGELRQELADLREVVFNQQNGAEEEKAEESKISFPYHTSRRLVAFGGHDSWLREIKSKLPDVRFMSDDISSPEIIKRADVVWIQTNCIGHKSYNIIIDLARKYSRKVRYFAYASATKCAEQIVEEEENTDK